MVVKADSLLDILEHPERVRDLSRDVIAGILAQLAALQMTLAAQLIASNSGDIGPIVGQQSDRLLNVQEAARKLDMSEDYLYRHADKLPFAVRTGRRRHFSERGIERYIRQKVGR